jgi:DNA-binding transcriptional LysR family regulator
MLEVFKAVADRGSFTKAADALGLSNAVTSRALQELEAQLGVRLLQRTTRSVSLTAEGRDVLERAQTLLESYDDLLAASKVGAEETAGEIRMSAPSSLGGRRLGPLLAGFTERYPLVRVDLQLTDQQDDMVGEGVDLALRVGEDLRHSLIARRVGQIRLGIFASPAYLKRYGTPQHPGELARHHCLTYGGIGKAPAWQLRHRKTGEQGEWPARGTLHTNNGDALAAAAVCGSGLVLLPRYLVEGALSRGELKEVMSDWQSPAPGLYLAYASRRNQPARIRRLIEHLAERVGAALEDIDLPEDNELAALAAGRADLQAVEAATRPGPHLAWARRASAAVHAVNERSAAGEARMAAA